MGNGLYNLKLVVEFVIPAGAEKFIAELQL
jgi:hypothetical protein